MNQFLTGLRAMLAAVCAIAWTSTTLAQEEASPEEVAALIAHNEEQGIPPPVDTLPEGIVVIDGDIGMPAELLMPRATFNVQQWPDGIVPFEWDANVSFPNRLQMVAAMNLWQNAANITFVLRDGEEDYIHIQSATFNLSTGIGMIGDRQDIFVVSWNNIFIQAHELAHALGFFHEQQRADRDSFVDIEWNNVCNNCCAGGSDCAGQFQMGGTEIAYGPYDFDSVMHYGQCAWSECATCNGEANCRTITVEAPWNAEWQNAIGQRDHLSFMDHMTMSFLYPETNWRFVDQAWGGTETGEFLSPFNTISEGVADTPAGGTMWIQPSAAVYSAAATYTKAMTIRVPLGTARLGN